MQIVLRPATMNDLDTLDAIHTICMRPHVEPIYPWKPDFFRRTFDPSDVSVVILDGVEAGMLKVERDEATIYLRQISILPAYRNQGRGTELIRQIVAEGNASGVRVELHVLRGNPARSLYERLGFRVIRETETHHIMSTEIAG